MRASSAAATERKERKAAAASSSASHTSTATTTKIVSHNFQQPKASEMDAPSLTARRDNDDDDDHRPKEFAVMSSAAPRRLHDIAMAPPELKKFPRGVKTKHNSPAAGAGAGVLSMAQLSTRYAGSAAGGCDQAVSRDELKERKTKVPIGHFLQ